MYCSMSLCRIIVTAVASPLFVTSKDKLPSLVGGCNSAEISTSQPQPSVQSLLALLGI